MKQPYFLHLADQFELWPPSHHSRSLTEPTVCCCRGPAVGPAECMWRVSQDRRALRRLYLHYLRVLLCSQSVCSAHSVFIETHESLLLLFMCLLFARPVFFVFLPPPTWNCFPDGLGSLKTQGPTPSEQNLQNNSFTFRTVCLKIRSLFFLILFSTVHSQEK